MSVQDSNQQDVFTHVNLNLVRGNVLVVSGANMVVTIATGKLNATWEEATRLLCIMDNQFVQDEIIELAFLRRFPDYYHNQNIDWDTKVSTFGVFLEEAFNMLKSAIKPKTCGPDVIQKSYLRLCRT
ncbi:hypothetical protein PCANC_06859 [Puccinia coronata f. sp. avenae]|uniref:Uncharacterized protein n=1 Tax=Puccinia coronata f. sp. avenae TaxID=200324 RepID=A0A2N5T051_9BASI|nr:hypothetical protein PCANC_12453 [Puccinia coronata f. sp. avenae]PLW42888.1 hypothetical protein PCASD_07255 [Puccinia coronata f. sp. avenae]PLW53997.1 hypothetical protein PCANC_06859 [Puccinia coronata f. sp. avenae]